MSTQPGRHLPLLWGLPGAAVRRLPGTPARCSVGWAWGRAVCVRSLGTLGSAQVNSL